jgi:hypothetical protein
MMTHMCIDSTTRAAADLGFACSLAHDACATRDISFNGSRVTAESVQTAYLGALNGLFAKVPSATSCATSSDHRVAARVGQVSFREERGDPMRMTGIPFQTIDWSTVERTEHKGETGMAYWRTRHLGDLRIRMVEYSPGYRADHWCVKGHILLCLEGELHTELADGRKFVLTPGMTYQVADNAEPHRSFTPTGAELFVVD